MHKGGPGEGGRSPGPASEKAQKFGVDWWVAGVPAVIISDVLHLCQHVHVLPRERNGAARPGMRRYSCSPLAWMLKLA